MKKNDIIFIDELKVEASIGVFEWEKKIKQNLIFSLEMEYDFQDAASSDKVDDTVCYATVSQRVTELTQQKHVELLEALGEKIAQTLLTEFPIKALSLRIAKPGAVPAAKSVGIQLYRTKL